MSKVQMAVTDQEWSVIECSSVVTGVFTIHDRDPGRLKQQWNCEKEESPMDYE
jgi:hypothetical protein